MLVLSSALHVFVLPNITWNNWSIPGHSFIGVSHISYLALRASDLADTLREFLLVLVYKCKINQTTRLSLENSNLKGLALTNGIDQSIILS